MRIAVTGSEGQLMRSLVERAAGLPITLIPVGRPQLDLADARSVAPALRDARPDAIISAAAYTAVDKAEQDQEAAFAVNATGAAAVAEVAHDLRVPVLHVSTDYVFDGSKVEPYAEADAPRPVGVYGASKLAGEAAVRAACADSAIFRTAWVYSPFGANFVKTMLRLAADRDEVRVVADQIGNPTSALDIADGLLRAATRMREDSSSQLRGVFHMTARGETSWAGLAEAVFTISRAHGGPSARVVPITTAEYPTPAARPANSRLDCARLAETFGVVLPEWRPSVQAVVARLVGNPTSKGA